MKNFKKTIGKANLFLASLALGIGLVLPTQTAHAARYDKKCIVGVSGGIIEGGTTGGLAGTAVAGVPGTIVGTLGGGIGGGAKAFGDYCDD